MVHFLLGLINQLGGLCNKGPGSTEPAFARGLQCLLLWPTFTIRNNGSLNFSPGNKMKGHLNNINIIVYLSMFFNHVSAQVGMPRMAVFLSSAESKSSRHNLVLQNVGKTVEYRIILRKQQKMSSGGGSAFLDVSFVAAIDTRRRLR